MELGQDGPAREEKEVDASGRAIIGPELDNMTDTGAIYLDSHAFPVRLYQHAQADLVFLFCQAESEMGRISNQGAIEAMLEGSHGAVRHEDLIGALHSALVTVRSSKRIRAAARARIVVRTLSALPPDQIGTLRAVYGPDHQRGLEAWGMLSNLVWRSEVAHGYHRKSRSRVCLLPWLVRLSAKVIGVIDPRGNGRIRKRPTASENEIGIARTIEQDCRDMVLPALRSFEQYRPRRRV